MKELIERIDITYNEIQNLATKIPPINVASWNYTAVINELQVHLEDLAGQVLELAKRME